MCTVEGCSRPTKARGLCRAHYVQWLSDPQNVRAWKRTSYPSDEVLVQMMRETNSLTKVAERLGVSRGSFRDYVRIRPELKKSLEEVRTVLTPEQVAANEKAAKRRWRQSHPEEVKAAKRAWASNRSPEDVRKWNTYNASRRSPLTRMDADATLLSYEYEGIIREDPCAYCGKPKGGTVDHIESLNKGGSDEWDNKTGACQSCNSSKRDKDLLDFLLWRREHA